MAVRVKLSEIVDALDMHPPESSFLLDKKTGKIIFIEHAVLEAVEDGDLDELLADCPEWQKDDYRAARDYLDREDDFVSLPDPFEIDEYRMMERFSLSLDDERMSDELYDAIKGRGAFRMFKSTIHRLGIQQQWYDYRDAEIVALAKEWCEREGIEFTED